MKKVILLAMLTLGSYANALSLKSGVINGRTDINPDVPCQLEIIPQSNGWINAIVSVNGRMVYGFVVTSTTAAALETQNNLDEVQISGRLQKSGDRALFVSAENNELVSISYKALSDRDGALFGFKCLF